MTEETALTIQEEKALMARLQELGGMGIAGTENLEQGDIGMPPRFRISQQNAPIELGGDEEAPPGTIVNMLTKEVYQSLEIAVMMYLPTTRVMWPTPYNAGNDPLCISDDNKNPLPPDSPRKMTNRQPGPCATCPFAQFGELGEAPACKKQRNFLVLNLGETPEPAILTLQSTAIAPAKLLTSMSLAQQSKKKQNAILLVTQKIKNDFGQWFIPVFAKGRELTLKEQVEFAEQREDLKNLIITADIEVHDANGFNDDPAAEYVEEEMEAIPF